MLSFARTRELQKRSHALIPGGCHTYAKGDDQFPFLSPGFFERGRGCHVWDVDGNEFIEYGMGCRAVTLGHAFPPVIEAVNRELQNGSNFTRPSTIELECAEALLSLLPGAEMVKFCKDGSAATTAALKLARAWTGRDMIGLCADHPFFATNDWFIGTTPMDAGIPNAIARLSASFRYNDLDSIRRLFADYPGQVACLILEPSKIEEPRDGFLHRAQELCHEHGALFILDEMITGFRWHLGGGQSRYDVVPDLSTFGKALANGFAVSALAGRRKYMELGGLQHERERVFLLSTTHGAETHSLAAAIATMKFYREQNVIDVLYRQGERLRRGALDAARRHGLQGFVELAGPDCCLVYITRDAQRNSSQAFRSLFIQELVKRGVFGPSFVVSYSHTDSDIDRTIEAIDGALGVYALALEQGVERFLIGPASKSVYRRYN